MELLRRLDDIGYEKVRRAIAALALSLFAVLYLLVSLNAPPGYGAAFVALSVCYLIGFLAIVAEWFWGRWFASGLGWSGVMVGIVALIMLGWSPPLAIYGALHGVVVLMLLGKKMMLAYDLQESWRKRFNMDEFGVARLRKTVTRAAAALPSLILYVLGPKEGQGMALAALGVGTALLASAGLVGLVRIRTWGLVALAGAFVASATLSTIGTPADPLFACGWLGALGGLSMFPASIGLAPAMVAALLLVALAPFVAPAIRFLRDSR